MITDDLRDSLRLLCERIGAFTAVVTDATSDPVVGQVSSEVIALADDVTDALAVEPVYSPVNLVLLKKNLPKEL